MINHTFFINRSKVNKKGKCPIWAKFTLDGESFKISTGLKLTEDEWNSVKNLDNHRRLSGDLSAYQNTLIGLRQRYNTIQGNLLVSNQELTLANFRKLIQPERKKEHLGLVELFNLHISYMRKSSYSEATINKFEYLRNHVSEFISAEYRIKDINCCDKHPHFLFRFSEYLEQKKGHNNITNNKEVQRVCTVINHAVKRGKLEKNPFGHYEKRRVKRSVVYLTTQELKALENIETISDGLTRVKDVFLFSCYTGLAYNELEQLSRNHITQDMNGRRAIAIKRKKTNGDLYVPLIDRALEIIEKYKADPLTARKNRLLPVYSNQKVNEYLKVLADLGGIQKKITSHTARKTFATTIALDHGLSLETVSRLLGHTDISTTQRYYADITNDRVNKEMLELEKRLAS